MTPTQPYFFLQPIDCIQRMDGASWSEKVKAILSNGQQEVTTKNWVYTALATRDKNTKGN